MRLPGGLLLLALSVWAFSSVLPSVNAGSVTCGTNVVLKDAYGAVTCKSNMQMDKIEVAAGILFGNIITFTITASFSTQRVYVFNVWSYGNSTLNVNFVGPEPFRVTSQGHTVYSAGTESVRYSGGDLGYGANSTLIVDYVAIMPILRDAAYTMALLTPITLTILFADYARDPFSPERPKKMERIFYVAIAMSFSTAVLVIMSLLFT